MSGEEITHNSEAQDDGRGDARGAGERAQGAAPETAAPQKVATGGREAEGPPAEAALEVEEEGGSEANREAAKYRRRLREVEGERDNLQEQLTAARRALVEQHIGSEIKPAALWASGATLESLLDDSGAINFTLVDAAVAHARDVLGVAGVPRASRAQGAPENHGPSGATWEDVVRGRL